MQRDHVTARGREEKSFSQCLSLKHECLSEVAHNITAYLEDRFVLRAQLNAFKQSINPCCTIVVAAVGGARAFKQSHTRRSGIALLHREYVTRWKHT